MRVPSSVEAQLRGAALAADRANRPSMLVIVPSLLLVGALLLTLLLGARFLEAKRTLSRRVTDHEVVLETVAKAERLRRQTPDLDAVYPPMPRLADDIDREAKRIWPDGGTSRVRVGQLTPGRVSLSADGSLRRVDVECALTEVSFDDLTTWIKRVIDDPSRSRVFISKLELQPSARGWNGQVEFRAYEKR